MLGASRLVLHSDVVHYSRKGKTCVSVKIYIYIVFCCSFAQFRKKCIQHNFCKVGIWLVHGWVVLQNSGCGKVTRDVSIICWRSLKMFTRLTPRDTWSLYGNLTAISKIARSMTSWLHSELWKLSSHHVKTDRIYRFRRIVFHFHCTHSMAT